MRLAYTRGPGCPNISINGTAIVVFGVQAHAKDLGHKLSRYGPNKVDIESWIACAWRTVHAFTQEPTGTHYS
eukprot:7760217-Pyramimonas_sp.AAC.1